MLYTHTIQTVQTQYILHTYTIHMTHTNCMQTHTIYTHYKHSIYTLETYTHPQYITYAIHTYTTHTNYTHTIHLYTIDINTQHTYIHTHIHGNKKGFFQFFKAAAVCKPRREASPGPDCSNVTSAHPQRIGDSSPA